MTNALIAVDFQYDFVFEDGALGMHGGYKSVVKTLAIAHEFDFVYASMDWHPFDHCSFAAYGGEWAPHCVRFTYGAGLVPEIAQVAQHYLFKGKHKECEAYSAFDGTGLAAKLRKQEVTEVTVVGHRLEYCVKATAIDAWKSGFDTTLYVPGCASGDFNAGVAAIQELQELTVRFRT